MSDLVPVQAAEVAVTQTDTDSWTEVIGEVAKLAAHIAGTEFVPKGLRNSPAAVTAAILYGRETGLAPMTALTQTHVIEGKPAMSAEAMRGLVLGAGHEILVVETTGAVCRMKGRRRGSSEWTEIVWTLDMARAAGVAGKQVWKAYPRQMLQARATTELVRLVFPDVIHGFRAVEEFDDVEAATEAPAVSSGSTVQRKGAASRKRATKAEAPALAAPVVEDDLPPLPDEEEPHEQPAADPVLPASGPQDGEEVPPTSSPSIHHDEPDVYEAEVIENEEEPEQPPAPPAKASQAQQRMLFAQLKGLGVEVPADRYRVAHAVLGREVTTYSDLSKGDASKIVDTLSRFSSAEDLLAFLDMFEQSTLAVDEEPEQ